MEVEKSSSSRWMSRDSALLARCQGRGADLFPAEKNKLCSDLLLSEESNCWRAQQRNKLPALILADFQYKITFKRVFEILK